MVISVHAYYVAVQGARSIGQIYMDIQAMWWGLWLIYLLVQLLQYKNIKYLNTHGPDVSLFTNLTSFLKTKCFNNVGDNDCIQVGMPKPSQPRDASVEKMGVIDFSIFDRFSRILRKNSLNLILIIVTGQGFMKFKIDSNVRLMQLNQFKCTLQLANFGKTVCLFMEHPRSIPSVCSWEESPFISPS